jgi:uncharacterized protein
MPEYLAPGVYVEEVSFRAKSIEGVSTTTTGFIGPARYGPTDLPPDIITSLGEFERVYGDRQQLLFTYVDPTSKAASPRDPMHNYLWHAVRAFFEEGGKRLYVVRVFNPISATNDGRARAWLPVNTPPAAPAAPTGSVFGIAARFPGAAGRLRVRLTVNLGQNVLRGDKVKGSTALKPQVGGVADRDVVWISQPPSPLPSPLTPTPGDYHIANSYADTVNKEQTWRFLASLASPLASPLVPLELRSLHPDLDPTRSDRVRVVTLTVTVVPLDGSALPLVWSGVALDPQHARAGTPDSLFDLFADRPANADLARSLPIIVTPGQGIVTGLDVLQVLFKASPQLQAALDNPASTDDQRSIELVLAGGNDGQRPTADQYEGQADPNDTRKTGLMALEDIDDISIVAAPGSTFNLEKDYGTDALTITNLLISHATRMRYRIAVLDSGDNQSITQVRRLRAKIDSSYAALYYPWVKILDPVTGTEIYVPPSGFVTGIYARNDTNRAVYKAPANEVVNLALGFEQLLNKSQQEVLNPEGINCFRFFEGRGYRLWGARTASSDQEWKYVNLRRYFAYLEHSIDRGTQFAVFEPNGPALWANVRRTIEDFLLNEWQSGALLGDKPEKAYFVRCDRSTMTQNDLDNGRLVCLIGVAPLRPAEFVIFRIGQFTADSKS